MSDKFQNPSSYAQVRQSNYLEQAFNTTMTFINDKFCKNRLAMVQVSQDDENTAVMRYFLYLFRTFQAALYDISALSIDYDSDCKPQFKLNGNDHFVCLFGLYPKEWLVTEVT